MDAMLNGESADPTTGFPVWDFFVDTVNMIVPMLTDPLESQQQAEVAATLILGSIPNVPQVGVDWPGFLGGTVTFPAVDSQVRAMMSLAGHPDYYPSYSLINGMLQVTPTHNPAAT